MCDKTSPLLCNEHTHKFAEAKASDSNFVKTGFEKRLERAVGKTARPCKGFAKGGLTVWEVICLHTCCQKIEQARKPRRYVSQICLATGIIISNYVGG